jgi:hypothetical protein
MSRIIFYIFLFTNFSFYSSIIIQEINQTVFLDPQTNTAFIRCPLDSKNIQWYDQDELYHGRYYRINGLQPLDKELICSRVGKNEEYKFKIRTYGKTYFSSR